MSLLERLRRPAEQQAWARFVKLYTPLLFAWAGRLGRPQDAADLVQDVFLALYEKLPTFRYDRGGTFRGWLWTVMLNIARNQHRRRPLPLEGPNALAAVGQPAEVEARAEAEYRQHLVARALELMQADFQPATWQAFWQSVTLGHSAAEVASSLGLSVNAVRAAKFRVLCRLRQELNGLLD